MTLDDIEKLLPDLDPQLNEEHGDLVRKLLAVVKAVKGFKVVETANELGPNDNPYWVLTCKSYEPFLKALAELEK